MDLTLGRLQVFLQFIRLIHQTHTHQQRYSVQILGQEQVYQCPTCLDHRFTTASTLHSAWTILYLLFAVAYSALVAVVSGRIGKVSHFH